MIPRDYQRAAVDAARDQTAAHGNTMLVLPTGAGKTAIAGFYIGEEVEDTRDARVLVLQHTDELIEQNRGAIAKVTGLWHLGGEGRAGRLGRPHRLRQRPDARRANRRRGWGVSHLVIDECHRSAAAESYQSIIAHVRGAQSGGQAARALGHARPRRWAQPAQDLQQCRLPAEDRHADRSRSAGAAAHLHHRSRRRGRTGRARQHRGRLRHARGGQGAEPRGPERGGRRALEGARRRPAHHLLLRHGRPCRGGGRGIPAAGVTAETVTGEMPDGGRAPISSPASTGARCRC